MIFWLSIIHPLHLTNWHLNLSREVPTTKTNWTMSTWRRRRVTPCVSETLFRYFILPNLSIISSTFQLPMAAVSREIRQIPAQHPWPAGEGGAWEHQNHSGHARLSLVVHQNYASLQDRQRGRPHSLELWSVSALLWADQWVRPPCRLWSFPW